MRIEESGRWFLVIFLAAALLSTALAGNDARPTATSAPDSGAQVAAAPVISTSGPLSYHAALYVNDSAPAGNYLPGEEVSAQFEVQIPKYVSPDGALQVRIPNSLAEFPSTQGELHVYLSAVNFTVTSDAVFEAAAGPAARWTQATAFNASGVAFVSTQGLSVMGSWAYGEFSVKFSWRWVMTAVDGTPTSGNWSPMASVDPPSVANLASSPAHYWTVAEPYRMCMNGPIGGRTFGIHVSIANPVEQFNGAAFTVPSGFTNAYCWNNTLPTNLSTQQAFIHIWEFANVTFQLYDFPIQLMYNGTGSSGFTDFVHSSYLPLLLIGIAVVLGIVAVVELSVLRARRRRRM
jgi:hypothetical protein